MPAVNLALDDVNHEKNLLPGFILKLHSNDSQVYEMFNNILKKNTIDTIIAKRFL